MLMQDNDSHSPLSSSSMLSRWSRRPLLRLSRGIPPPMPSGPPSMNGNWLMLGALPPPPPPPPNPLMLFWPHICPPPPSPMVFCDGVPACAGLPACSEVLGAVGCFRFRPPPPPAPCRKKVWGEKQQQKQQRDVGRGHWASAGRMD